MLTKSYHRQRPTARTQQRGIVLIIALIVLVAMMLAGVAMVRSVDTTTIIAGNLAFRQSATNSADAAAETAITWLETRYEVDAFGRRTTLPNPDTNQPWTERDDVANGYYAAGNLPQYSPAANESWDAFWTKAGGLVAQARALPADAIGNQTSYVIHRLCQNVGDPTSGANCASSPVLVSYAGNEQESGKDQIASSLGVYYRITIRSQGPRGTVSYIQTIVAL
jgi:type IV pilus assembly protein PilX